MDPAFALFVMLLSAHIAGDFVLQTQSDAIRKNEPVILLKHAGIVGLTSYLVAGVWSAWIIPLAVFLSHAIVDPLKLRFSEGTQHSHQRRLAGFIVDQAVHIAVIWGLSLYLARSIQYEHLFWAQLFGDTFLYFLILISGAIVSTKIGGVVIGILVSPYLRQLESHVGTIDTNSRGFIDGGRIIGYLERFLIYIFIIAGFPLGIGFLITAKSVFRFGEVSNPSQRMEAEYIIIGTLMSFAYAAAVGYGVYAVLGLV